MASAAQRKMEVWKELNVTLRIKVVSYDKRIREYTGKFDFSQYISNIEFQYVLTRDLQNFQRCMKQKKYDIVFSENNIEVTYHVTQNRRVDIDIEGHELCAEIKHFLAGYSSKPILVPEKANTEYVNTVTEMKQGNPTCEIFWDPERHSYWITGKREDVLKAYHLFQKKKKELWFAVPSATSDKTLEWSITTAKTTQYDDFDIKFEINTGADRRLTTRGGTFKVSEYLDMSVIQYMFTYDRKYFRSCTKAAGLSYRFSEGILTLACRSPLQCTDLDEIGVTVTNFIVHVTSIYSTQLLVVPEKIRDEFSKKLNDWISGGENRLFADCVWLGDRSAVSLVCPLEHCTENYTVLRDLLESRRTKLECAQSPVEVLFSESQDKTMEKWNRTIGVSGVRQTTTSDSVEFYFENSERSGGSTVEDIRCKDGVYHITFESTEVAERVLKRKHKIEGVEVEVQKHIPFTVKHKKGLENDDFEHLSVDEIPATNVMDTNDDQYCNDLSGPGGVSKDDISRTGGATKGGLSMSGGATKGGLSMSGGAAKGGLSNTRGAAKGEIPVNGGTSKDEDKTKLLVPDIWQNFSITVGKGEKESLSGELSPSKMQYLLTKNWPQIKSEAGMSVTYEVNKNDCNLTVGDSTGRQSGDDIVSGLVEYFKALLQTTSQTMVNIQDLDEGFLMFIGTSLYKHVQDKDAYIAYNKRGKEIVITGNISNIRRCQRVIEKGMKEYKDVVHKKLNLGSQKVEFLKKSELLKKEKIMSKCKVDVNESEGSILLTGSLKDIKQCEQFVTKVLRNFRSIQRKIETGVRVLLSYQDTVNWINRQLLLKDLDVVWKVTNDGLLEIQGLTTDLCKAAVSFILHITSPVKVDRNIPYSNGSILKLFAEYAERKLYYDRSTEQCYVTVDVKYQILDILGMDKQRKSKENLVMTQKSHTPQLKFTGDTRS